MNNIIKEIEIEENGVTYIISTFDNGDEIITET
jgi:hypothetical protein